ncbi:MaoC family dehydratase N-terminal domain-containing protein [Chloroflexota bacterium]
MTADSIVTDEIRKYIGARVGAECHPEEVTNWAIKRYLEATTDENPLWQDEEYARKSRWGGIIAPPTFVEVFSPSNYAFRQCNEMMPSLNALPFELPFPNLFEAFNEHEFFLPIRPGDFIQPTCKIGDIYEKVGKGGVGRMVFVRRDNEYWNQNHELVAITRWAVVFFEGTAPTSAPATPPVSAPSTIEQPPLDTRQIYFDDVEIGSELPPLVKHISLVTIVKWAAALNDYGPHHFDYRFATEEMGLRDVIAHGPLNCALLAQFMTNWIGGFGVLKKHYAEMRGNVFPGDTLVFHGKVVNKYLQDGEGFIDCETWAENQEGSKVTPGRSTVTLPLKK